MPDDANRRHALIAVDGDLPGRDWLRAAAAAADVVIAADGTALRLVDAGIVPDVVIGDLDSLGAARATLAAAGAQVIERPSQEENDLDKALAWAAEAGYTDVTVIGTSGGTLDHAINNLSVLARNARRLRIDLRDERSIGYLIHGLISLATTAEDRISLIPLPAATLTTRGLRWELHSEELAIGIRDGASNAALGAAVVIEVHAGLVMVVHFGKDTVRRIQNEE